MVAATSPVRAGTEIGDYRVIKKLGEGGMGSVYLAAHKILGQKVCLKGLHADVVGDREMRARLVREAEAMARLTHPNIVAIHNFIQAEEGIFIVMEYVDGTTFDDLIARTGLIPPARAVELLKPALAALDYAHRQGVIHRDLKPSNLMLDTEGRVHVLDFGTAKLVDRPGLTRVGMTLGTANYMAPEQLRGQQLTPAADLYALGATLYEMTTGHLPFEAETTSELFQKVLRDEPVPPSVYYPPLPKALEKAILRTLLKDPRARFASATEMMAELDRAVADVVPAPVPMPMPAPRPSASHGAAPPAAATGPAPRPPAPPAARAEPSAAAPPVPPMLREALAGAVAAAIGVVGGAGGLSLAALGQPVAGAVFAAVAALAAAIGAGRLAWLQLDAAQKAMAKAAAAPPPQAAPAAAPPPPPPPPVVPAPPILPPGARASGARPTWRHVAFTPAAAPPPEAPAAEVPPPVAPEPEWPAPEPGPLSGSPNKTIIASGEEISRAIRGPAAPRAKV